MSKLAIVIPAYKNKYFEQVLFSIANQTNKDFKVYIGDDCSPDDLYSIVKKFENRISIVYRKFEENLGGKDLVAQWKRCIDLVSDEKWIWLFSDDDLMDQNCVEIFYNNVDLHTKEDLFHFNVKRINERNEIIGKYQPFPNYLLAEELFSKRIRNEISSYVVEYIFNIENYNKFGGFENFDLAWNSDDASWIKFSIAKGITTLSGAFIQWRYSGDNISSKTEDKTILLRKLKASENYLRWVNEFFKKNDIIEHTSRFEKAKWMLSQFIESKAFSLKEKWRYIKGSLYRLDYYDIKIKISVYLVYMEMKKRWS